MKDKLTSAHVLTLPEYNEEFVVYCEASIVGLGCVLMHHGEFIAYASTKLKVCEKNYKTHDLELGIVVFSLKYGDIICVLCMLMYVLTLNILYVFTYEELNPR